jgi:hypothetical protein
MAEALSSLLKSDKFDDASSLNESLKNNEFKLSLDIVCEDKGKRKFFLL